MSTSARCDICDGVVYGSRIARRFMPLVKTKTLFGCTMMNDRADICGDCWKSMSAMIQSRLVGCPMCGHGKEGE